jgi:hypothetical protein
MDVSIGKAFFYSLGLGLRNNVTISLHKFIKTHEFEQKLKPSLHKPAQKEIKVKVSPRRDYAGTEGRWGYN